SNCVRCVLIMRLPEAISLLTQLMLIALADLLDNLAHVIQVGDLTTHLVHLIGMECNLAGLGAGVVYIENPLVVAYAAGAGRAGDSGGVEGVPFKQGAAK